MRRLLAIGLLVTSLFGYLSWANQSAWLWEIEWQVFAHPSAESLHPLIVLPLAGQLILLADIIVNGKSSRWFWIGTVSLALLLAMVFFTAAVAGKPMGVLSAIPFAMLMILAIVCRKRLTRH